MASIDTRQFLWPSSAPGASGDGPEDQPWFSVHLPSQGSANRPAVIICPGGAYRNVCDTYEGVEAAEWLNAIGVAAFVLRYRTAPKYKHPSPLQDAQRMIRLVRFHASDWGIDPTHVGIWGFSAGGHLAASAGTLPPVDPSSTEDSVDRQSCRPDFMILSYPVITMKSPFTHEGSRTNLIGDDAEYLEALSLENAVTSATPPAFIFHTDADSAVPAENSAAFYLALRRFGIPAELHIFKNGSHGVGLAKEDPSLRIWPSLLENWMRTSGILEQIST